MMIKIIFLFLMVFTIYQSNKVLAADKVVTVDQIVTFLDQYQNDIEKAVKKISSNKKLDKSTMLKYYFKRIFAKNSDIYQRITPNEYLLAGRQADFFSYLRKTLPDFPTNRTSKMLIDIFKIHYNFQQYREFDEKTDTEKSIKTYVNKNIDKVIPKKLSNLFDHILKSRAGPNLLDRIIEEIDNIPEESCDDKGSLQDKFYNFYIACILTDLLATTTMIDSYGVQELIKSGSGNKKKLKNIIAESKKRITEYSKEFTLSIGQIPINYRNCDPSGDEIHERGVTYIEMAGLYQNILMFSRYLGSETSCVTCENVYIKNGTNNRLCHIKLDETTPWDENGVPENFKSCTTPRNCYGRIHGCVTMWTPEFCMLKNDVRRYKWIRDKYDPDKYSYGDINSGCSDGEYDYREYEYESYAKFSKCSYCWCVCDDVSPQSKLAVNKISLLPAMSRIAKNKVVTGARIIMKDNILHIQVAEGVIEPNYIVQSFSDEWVRLPDMKDDIQESLANGGTGKLKQDTDYVLCDYDKNAINMDEITIEYGRVVTGVKFGMKKEEGKHPERIQIQVHSTEYDWKSGKLLKDTEKWHYPDGEHNVTSPVNQLSPLQSNKETTIDSKTNEFYIFKQSDSKTDAGQTTLPLFDASFVGAKVPAALSGIGLHHRSSNRKNAGFFGLTAYSVNYDQYMNELYPDA
ncbi:hypothetical protein HCN44_003123 [Aphidius gifuensis]|uniref:Venom protein n=1 Tax=Aphidius gifuensis TaxID=684658 RepID=A0A834XMC8_APHGI|nr:hypothetical protein HCN44_003123 [Aphidius gifuensis]